MHVFRICTRRLVGRITCRDGWENIGGVFNRHKTSPTRRTRSGELSSQALSNPVRSFDAVQGETHRPSFGTRRDSLPFPPDRRCDPLLPILCAQLSHAKNFRHRTAVPYCYRLLIANTGKALLNTKIAIDLSCPPIESSIALIGRTVDAANDRRNTPRIRARNGIDCAGVPLASAKPRSMRCSVSMSQSQGFESSHGIAAHGAGAARMRRHPRKS